MDDDKIPPKIKEEADTRKKIEKAIDEAKAAMVESFAKSRPDVQKVEVTNQEKVDIPEVEFPDVQKVSIVEQIVAKVTNFPKWPEFMKISGRVKADVDFPNKQEIKGKVEVDFPTTQDVIVKNLNNKVKIEGLPLGESKKKGLPDKFLTVRLTDGQDFYSAQGGVAMGGNNVTEWPKQAFTYDANENLTRVVESEGSASKTTDLIYDANNLLTDILVSTQ